MLVKQGKIAKLGYGVYTKLKQSILTGKPITCKPLSVLVKEALEKLWVLSHLLLIIAKGDKSPYYFKYNRVRHVDQSEKQRSF